MKLPLSFLVTSILLATCEHAAADLTIQIHASLAGSSNKSAQQMMDRMAKSTVYIKGNKMRLETSMFDMIVDLDGKKMTMFQPGQKEYSVTPLPAGFTGGLSAAQLKGLHQKVTKVGAGSVLGVPCEEYTVSSSMTLPQQAGASAGKTMNVGTTVWVAKSLPGVNPKAMKALSALAGGAYGAQLGGYPLKYTIATGNGTMVIAATAIKPGSISDSEFRVPSGYKLASGGAQSMLPGMKSMR